MSSSKPIVKTEIIAAGWIMLLLCCVVFFLLGFIFAEEILLVLSLFFILFIIGVRFLGRYNIQKIKLDIRMKERLYAGKSYDVTVYLDNKKNWLSSHGLDLSIEVLNSQKILAGVKWLGAGNGAKLVQKIVIPHRGATTSCNYKIQSTFPLGLFRHELKDDELLNLLVYPRLLTPQELMNFGDVNSTNPLRGAQLGDTQGEFRGVRDWQPGDQVKRIHWPASARSLIRGQGLRVKELDPPGFAPESCLVLFHSYAEQGELYRSDRFERACSLAAGVLHYFHSRYLQPAFVADFLGWTEIECLNRQAYIELLAILANAKRCVGTMQHELQEVIDRATKEVDQIVIVSDMDPDSWLEGVTIPANTLVVDIRQMRFSREMIRKAS